MKWMNFAFLGLAAVLSGCGANVCDGNETHTTCGVTRECTSSLDCASGSCQMQRCVAATCTDDLKNGTESDLDCGGTCGACPLGRACIENSDCQSGTCVGNLCLAPTCTDEIKNGTELDLDCGGTCGACPLGRACIENSDCQSGTCVGNRCLAPALLGGPGEHNFGTVLLNTKSAAATFTIHNLGEARAGAPSFNMSGPDASQFKIASDGCSGVALAGSRSCVIKVLVIPTATGPMQAVLDVSAAPGGKFSVALQGNAVTQGSIRWVIAQPASYAYQDQAVGTASAEVAFNATNISGSNTGALAAVLSDTFHFSMMENSCVSPLVPGGSCRVRISFQPKLAGTRAATLSIGDAAGTDVVSLSGLAVAQLTVQKPGGGSGTVSSGDGKIRCGDTCSAPYGADTVVLTAAADAGSSFTGWSGAGCSGTAPCQVRMDAAKTVAANFVLQTKR